MAFKIEKITNVKIDLCKCRTDDFFQTADVTHHSLSLYVVKVQLGSSSELELHPLGPRGNVSQEKTDVSNLDMKDKDAFIELLA